MSATRPRPDRLGDPCEAVARPIIAAAAEGAAKALDDHLSPPAWRTGSGREAPGGG